MDAVGMKAPKKKSTWMKGFVLGPKSTESDRVRYDTFERVTDFRHKQIKNRGK